MMNSSMLSPVESWLPRDAIRLTIKRLFMNSNELPSLDAIREALKKFCTPEQLLSDFFCRGEYFKTLRYYGTINHAIDDIQNELEIITYFNKLEDYRHDLIINPISSLNQRLCLLSQARDDALRFANSIDKSLGIAYLQNSPSTFTDSDASSSRNTMPPTFQQSATTSFRSSATPSLRKSVPPSLRKSATPVRSSSKPGPIRRRHTSSDFQTIYVNVSPALTIRNNVQIAVKVPEGIYLYAKHNKTFHCRNCKKHGKNTPAKYDGHCLRSAEHMENCQPMAEADYNLEQNNLRLKHGVDEASLINRLEELISY